MNQSKNQSSNQSDSQKHQQNHEAASPAWMDEPDIGSGEKTPGEKETEAIVRSVPPTGQGSGGSAGTQDGQQEGGKK